MRPFWWSYILIAALALAWVSGAMDSPHAQCDPLSALPWLRCAP